MVITSLAVQLGNLSSSRAERVGHWTFENGQELVDQTGNFPDLLLMGDAAIAEGALDVNGAGTDASGWAITDSDSGAYGGPPITNKTLVSWITLQGLEDVCGPLL